MIDSPVTVCSHCGTRFTAKRSDARYCSPRCRVAALRERRHSTQGRRQPLTEQFTHHTVLLDKHLDSLERDAHNLQRLLQDDRMTAHMDHIKAQNGSDIKRAINALTAQADVLSKISSKLYEK